MPIPIIDRRRVVVRVTRSALIDMLMASIESATVPPLMLADSEEKYAAVERLRHRHGPNSFLPLPMSLLFSANGLPVAGLLWGVEQTENDLTTYRVDRMWLASANRNDLALWTSERSPLIVAEVAQATGSAGDVLGEFFSRPRFNDAPSEIELARTYRLPRAPDTAPAFKGDRVTLAMTITRANDYSVKGMPQPGSVSQFRVGAWEIWLAALLPHRRYPTQGPTLVIEPLQTHELA